MASRDQIIGTMRLLNDSYPDAKFAVNDTLVEVWCAILGGFDIEIIKAACVKLIAESPYPPKVADICNQIRAMHALGTHTPAEAWGIVSNNIRLYGYYQVNRGRLALPPLIRRVVDMIGYQSICADERPDVIRRQFMDMYEQVVTRERDLAMLPDGVAEVVKQIASVNQRQQIRGGEPVSLKQLLSGKGE